MNPDRYPRPIPLTELVEAVGVDGVHALATQLGVLDIGPKVNQI